jgi:cell division septation protein DedD
MRTSNQSGRLLGFLLILTILPLISLFAQEEKIDTKTYLEKATEEVPNNPKLLAVKLDKPSNESGNTIHPNRSDITPAHSKNFSTKQNKASIAETRTVLENITEEVPAQPKPMFVSSKHNSAESYKIQLGYFKNKNNVFQLVHKIKKDHDWSVYIKTENNNGTDFYRVLIVDVSSKRSAEAIIGQLKAEGLKAILK